MQRLARRLGIPLLAASLAFTVVTASAATIAVSGGNVGGNDLTVTAPCTSIAVSYTIGSGSGYYTVDAIKLVGTGCTASTTLEISIQPHAGATDYGPYTATAVDPADLNSTGVTINTAAGDIHASAYDGLSIVVSDS